MNARIRQIDRKLRAVQSKLARARLTKLPEQLQFAAITGEPPEDELAKAYLDLTGSALVAMDASIGGEDHDQACTKHDESLAAWRGALKRVGL